LLGGAALLVAIAAFLFGRVGRAPSESSSPVTTVAVGPLALGRPECASAIVVEAQTGTSLYEHHADDPRAPASLVKMMVELVVFEEVDKGRLSLADTITVSKEASKMGGSQIYLEPGDAYPVEELMRAVTIASANDACAAVAEHVAGSREAFVTLMNDRARRLGLKTTRFVNVHGLDDVEEDDANVTTAREVAAIGREMIKHSKALEWSSTRQQHVKQGKLLIQNTNLLIGKFPGMDGLKTGHTNRAGFNLCATAEREGRRFVSVVLGANSRKECAAITAKLLNQTFAETELVVAASVGRPAQEAPLPVRWSRGATVTALATRRVHVLVPAGRSSLVRTVVDLPDRVNAPLGVGQRLGTMTVSVDGDEIASVPLVSGEAVPARGLGAILSRLPGM
jgi:D-alanyl-D-alanine carboxypeptidase (penicillin-binding protein 5/6)